MLGDMLIEESDLSTRSKNQLTKNGIVSFKQLQKLNDDELSKIRNLGQKSLDEIRELRDSFLERKLVEVEIPKNSCIEDIYDLPIDSVIKERNILENLKRNNIKRISTLVELIPEDIKKYRDLEEEEKDDLWDIIILLKRQLKINYVDISLKLVLKSNKSFKDIIDEYLPHTKAQINYKFLYKNKISSSIKIGQLNELFSKKERNFIEKMKINNVDNFLKENNKHLMMQQGISNSTINRIIEWFAKHLIIYSKKRVYICDIATMYLIEKKLGYLLQLKDELTQKILKNINDNVIKLISLNDYSLRFSLDLLKDNEEFEKGVLSRVINNNDSSEIIYTYLKKNGGVINQYQIEDEFNKFKNVDVTAAIDKLINKNLAELKEKKLYYKNPSVFSYVKEKFNDQVFQAFKKRMEGYTLEEIGQELGVTREGIRQINKKVIDRLPEKEFLEDKNMYWFTNYIMDKNTYNKIFSDNNYTYLSLRYENGDRDWSEILKDEKASDEIRKKVQSLVYKNLLVLGDKTIPKNKGEVLKYVISEFIKTPTHVKDILDFYNLFLEEQSLNEEKFICDIRYLENRLTDLDFAVSRGKKIFRAYLFETYDWEEFYKELRLGEWQNTELSAKILFESHEDLMKKYNILHENELHNIIKRTHEKYLDIDITVTRMPGLNIGNADREIQVKEFMLEISPISVEDFVKCYRERYGVKESTIKANYLVFIDKYIYEDYIDVTFDNLKREDIEAVKQAINSQDFLFYKDFLHDLNRNISSENIGLILKYLKYKKYITYLLGPKYPTIRSYFDKQYYEDRDIIDFNELDKRIWELSSFNSWLYDKIINLDMIEFQDKKFISIKKLKDIGIKKSELLNYRNEAIKKMSDGHVWSLTSLINIIDDSTIDSLGFEPIFYRSLIRDGKRVRTNNVGKNYLLQLDENPTLLTIIEEEILKRKSIDIYELTQLLNEKFDLSLTKGHYTSAIYNSGLYYDQIMEKIYLDINYYYEEFEI